MEVFELYSELYSREKQEQMSLQDYLLACRNRAGIGHELPVARLLGDAVPATEYRERAERFQSLGHVSNPIAGFGPAGQDSAIRPQFQLVHSASQLADAIRRMTHHAALGQRIQSHTG